ncbi:hypothetical protein OIV83_004185 [Microbotryomycetes sp. JL201]|nr:hypothetical protein OIV83_004185 [Microbotryomycetes sp. JL201]
MSRDQKDHLPTEQDVSPPSYDETQTTALLEDKRCAARPVSSQPTLAPAMTINAATRNPLNLKVGLDGKREWSNHICACHERPMLTLAACCCPCSVWAANHSRTKALDKTGQPIKSPEYVGTFCCMYVVMQQITGIGHIAMQSFSRFKNRERYAIRGSALEDALWPIFCQPCALVQEAREIEGEEQAVMRQEVPAPIYRDEEEAVDTRAV